MFMLRQNFNGLQLSLHVFAYQIYCDFSGYSDITSAALRFWDQTDGEVKTLYIRSIPEFWRRWHISLSTWFRDYLHIPLGGSRYGIGVGAGDDYVCVSGSGMVRTDVRFGGRETGCIPRGTATGGEAALMD